NSSSVVTSAAPGRVDSPPRSSTSAPSAIICPARSTTACELASKPPSENESGVAFNTPMINVRPPIGGNGRPCGLCQESIPPNEPPRAALSTQNAVTTRIRRDVPPRTAKFPARMSSCDLEDWQRWQQQGCTLLPFV